MTRKAEVVTLVLVDALAVLAAYALHYAARFDWQVFGVPDAYPVSAPTAAAVLAAFWLLVLGFFGLYKERYAASRFDEMVSVFKAVTFGMLALVFAIYIESLSSASARMAVFGYWLAVGTCLAVGRAGVRSVQKRLRLRGYGLHKTLVVGWGARVREVYEEVARYPEAGLKIVGAVRLDAVHDTSDEAFVLSEHAVSAGVSRAAGAAGASAGSETNVLAVDVADDSTATPVREYEMEELPRLIERLGIQDVLIALGGGDQEGLMDVLRICDGQPVNLKVVPDFYSVIGGMARTEHMYGLPLVELLPVPMTAWEQATKRLLDILVSAIVLIVGLPVWLVLGVLVRGTSAGPAIYRQQRVGQHGRPFTMYKFRTMRQDAEAATGPVWAAENDPRYTPIGRWLRKTRLDEIPQFWNVLKGDMSLVGPRPERPYFVSRLRSEIPLYGRRHRVKPGITGWAQVKWKYDESLDDVRQKVKYDLFYIGNMSLRMDFKILLRTIRTALTGRGQ